MTGEYWPSPKENKRMLGIEKEYGIGP